MTDKSVADKPTLVLLHGWGVNQGVWQSICQSLPATTTVLTPDLPGFGKALQFPPDYTLDAVCQQLAAQIPDGSAVCGWSLGGLVALALARRYPHKVRQLALVAASPCFLAQADWPGMAPAVMQQFGQALTANLQHTIERFLAIQAMGSDSARADTKMLKQAIMAYPQAQPQAVAAALNLLRDSDLRAEFAALTIPLAGLFGRLDSLVPVKVVEQLQQLQPQGCFTILPHASHAPFISHPAASLAWLKHCLSPSGSSNNAA
ncbi:MAG: pimeloyl-ACP methyl ester esterase BioH [Gammaproteobacteria bacterium]|nr:pimeloyl-ACP methyl ester esterase BioH [Gammaproteobacteria bacterium]